jgi:hypothetical protein
MTVKKKAKTAPLPDDMPQLDKFKDAARDLECDDDERRFKERLGKLVKQKSGKSPGRDQSGG